MDLNFIMAFAFMMAFFIILNIFGMPAEYRLFDTFDFTVLSVSFIGIAVACNVITGLACVVGGAIFTLGTLGYYIGVSMLMTTTTAPLAIIKGFVFTPIVIGITYLQAKMARGTG